MISGQVLLLFLGSALVLAAVPGPATLYIAGRTLGGGPRIGLASCAGTAVGGLVHVAAGALGVSALVLANAQMFLMLKVIGGVYLVYLGLQTWRTAGHLADLRAERVDRAPWSALRQGIAVEATNPKTAAFYLALLPQFIAPGEGAALQFVVLGTLSLLVNMAVAALVVWLVAVLRGQVLGRTALVIRLRRASGVMLGGLGVWLLLARRPA